MWWPCFTNLLVLVTLAYCCGCGQRTQQVDHWDREDVLRALGEVGRDFAHFQSRAAALGDRSIAAWMGRSFWESIYPVTYAYCRLAVAGNQVRETIERVAVDPQTPRDVRESALIVLAEIGHPNYLQLLARARKDGNLRDIDVYWHLYRYAPIERLAAEMPNDADLCNWLEEQVASKSPEDVILGLLDGVVADRLEPEERLKFLNRLYDVDLDEYLVRHSPQAAQFRARELAKGYDPASIAYALMNDRDWEQRLQAMYPDEQDRRAARALAKCLGGAFDQAGWRERLRTWYWANRPYLVYDPVKRYFVVRKPQPATAPASAPAGG